MTLLEELRRAHKERQRRFFPIKSATPIDTATTIDTATRDKKLADILKQLDELRAQVEKLTSDGMPTRRRTRLAEIIAAVSAETGLSEMDVRSHRRDRKCAEARHIVFYVAMKLTPMSYSQVGRLFDRDHTTVMHGNARIGELIKSNSPLGELVERVIRRLGAQ